MASIGWPARRSATSSAWWRPSGASSGSPWPSTSGNGRPGTIGSDSPWRTRSSSVDPGGRVKRIWRYSCSGGGLVGHGGLVRAAAGIGGCRTTSGAGPTLAACPTGPPTCSRRRAPCRPTPTRRTRTSRSAPRSATASGRVFAGCNVENASFPEGICAEAAAMGAMVSAGEYEIVEVLTIADGERLTTPCGGCRQRIREFARPDVARPRRRPRGRAPHVHARASCSRPRSAPSTWPAVATVEPATPTCRARCAVLCTERRRRATALRCSSRGVRRRPR